MEERGGRYVRPRHYVRQERRRPLLHRELGGAGRRRPATLAAQHHVSQQHAVGQQSTQRPHPVGKHPLRPRLPRHRHGSHEEKPIAENHL